MAKPKGVVVAKNTTAVQKNGGGFTEEQIDLIKKTIAVGATDDELKLFTHIAEKSGLDPLARQIHFVKMKGKMTVQTGIDGFRVVADRSGNYAGQTKIEYGKVITYMGIDVPEYAEIGVYRKDCEHPIYARAYFVEYVQIYIDKYSGGGEQIGKMWAKMPHLMIGKCAEALALRKAFPQDLSGIYTTDEMQQANQEPKKYKAKDEEIKEEPVPDTKDGAPFEDNQFKKDSEVKEESPSPKEYMIERFEDEIKNATTISELKQTGEAIKGSTLANNENTELRGLWTKKLAELEAKQ